jgi:hypothetical protein
MIEGLNPTGGAGYGRETPRVEGLSRYWRCSFSDRAVNGGAHKFIMLRWSGSDAGNRSGALEAMGLEGMEANWGRIED